MSVIQFKEANCKNCHKCIRSCPIKAIAFRDEQAKIVEDECILCGRCLTVCPQNAKSVKSDIDKVRDLIAANEKVFASIAPSFASAFDVPDAGKVFTALKRLGFAHVEETARGAVQVSKEYSKLLKQGKMKNIITSACPTINFLIEKHYPELLECLAPVVSPMIAHARMMKAAYGSDIKVVFVGPCISKKVECNDLQNEGVVDGVITFEELGRWMHMENMGFDIEDGESKGIVENGTCRFYPAPGGIIGTLDGEAAKNYKCMGVDGIERCMDILDSIRNSGASNYFIEMNSCNGGCLGGPCITKVKGGFLEAKEKLAAYVKSKYEEVCTVNENNVTIELCKKFVDKSKRYRMPDEFEVREILSRIGKFSKDKELNCGACGYPTCRDKAIAVFNNKADLQMCLPYMHERAESISNIIIGSTPNAIIALNMDLCIQEYNLAAKKLFALEKEDVRGKSVYEVLECSDFENVRETGRNVVDRKYHYNKYGVTVEQSILYIKEHQIILAVIKDVTWEEKQHQQLYKMRSETVDIAQKVIEKQMRVAQEIASLLGETTAETKMALTKLKNTISSD